jgi:hypothetical protein
VKSVTTKIDFLVIDLGKPQIRKLKKRTNHETTRTNTKNELRVISWTVLRPSWIGLKAKPS